MATAKSGPTFMGTVIKRGAMDKVVTVRRPRQVFDQYLQKHFTKQPTYLVRDPRNSARLGDVVRCGPWPHHKGPLEINYTLTEIVSAFGPRIQDRPPVPTAAEREQAEAEKQQKQEDRRQRLEQEQKPKKQDHKPRKPAQKSKKLDQKPRKLKQASA